MMKTNKYFILIVCIAMIVCGTSFSFAKYFGVAGNGYLQTSSKFYFGSSVITRNPSTMLFGGGEQSYDIDVNNFADSLRVTQTNITYSVTTTATNGYQGCTVTSRGNPGTRGVLAGGSANTDTLTINFASGYINETIITINITSTSPYAKTLTQIVTLHTVALPQYSVIDRQGSLYAELRITTTMEILAGALQIDWDETELTVDMNNNFVISANKTTNASDVVEKIVSGTTIPAYGSISIYFFKADLTLNYSTASSAITYSNSTYSIALPEKVV